MITCGGELYQVVGRDHRRRPHWRGAMAGGREKSQVEGSDRWWRGAIAGEEEQSLVEGSGLRWRRAFTRGGERRPERFLVEGSDRR